MGEFIPIIEGATAAQETVLRRKSWDQIEIPPDLQAGIERIFGESLTPDQAVARILEDVRRDGDGALASYNQRIDGVQLDELHVSEREMDDAWERTPVELRQALQHHGISLNRFDVSTGRGGAQGSDGQSGSGGFQAPRQNDGGDPRPGLAAEEPPRAEPSPRRSDAILDYEV